MALDTDVQRHKLFLAEAITVYRDKDGVRQGLWKKYTPRDQLVQAKIKIERCLHALEIGGEAQHENILKEVPDIINYVVFAARLIQPGEEGV